MVEAFMASGLVKSAAVAAGIALAACVPALARDAAVHVLNVVLPDGQVEQVRYRGAVPPHLVVVPVEQAVPVGFAASPFAALERVSALMDRQMDAMMQQAAALSRVTPALLTGGLPAGVSGSTYVATFSSDGACTRSTQITYAPGMARPQEVSQVTGSCAAGPMTQGPALMRAPVAPAGRAAPLTTLARDDQGGAKPVLRDALWRVDADQ
jgi:hypothetical protein